MNCLHGMGISHVIVDALMFIPLVAPAIIYIRNRKWKTKKS